MSLTEAETPTDPLSRPGARIRVGVVGCGDVARRRYLPGLANLADRVEIRACRPA